MKILKDGKSVCVDLVTDTIESISSYFDLTPQELVNLNSTLLKSVNDTLNLGDVLTVEKVSTPSSSSTVDITGFGLQAYTTRSMFVTWQWDLDDKTENYRVIWRWYAGDKDRNGNEIWFDGSDSTTSDGYVKQSTFNAPENAIRVYVKIKPNMKSGWSNGLKTKTEVGWTTEQKYNFQDGGIPMPPVPNVSINNYTLTAELDNVDLNGATHIKFEIIKDNAEMVGKKKYLAEIITFHASFSCTITAGSVYKVRCCAVRDDIESAWTAYSSNVQALPIAPSIEECTVLSKDSVRLSWTKINSADSYEVEYTTKKEYFDQSGGDVISDQTNNNTLNIYNMPTGGEYFVRVRSVNKETQSDWSEIHSFILGTTPSSPTTWSSTNSAIVGETLNLYWIHNSKDGSSQTWAELEIISNGESVIRKIKNTTDEEEKDKTSVYSFPTGDFRDGTSFEWRVRTAGVLTNDDGTPAYGDWSILREVDIYAPPVIYPLLLEDYKYEPFENLTTFPFHIVGTVGNTRNQKPVSYYITITNNKSYTTVDFTGNEHAVGENTILYSKHIDSTKTSLNEEITANDVDLENNIEYTVNVTVSMDSGLTAEEHATFTVGWIEKTYEPFAEIGIEPGDISAYIRPYSNGRENVWLSVYRRNFDGSFIEIESNLNNNAFITDPHPALDYARYRIVAKDKSTGAVNFSDVFTEVGEKAIVIQWDEQWQSFENMGEYVTEERPWSGSLLKLPYNITISDSYSPDTSLVKYIGRKHPVSYYGTQIGHTSSWSTDIPKSDTETLYALRRLASWMGDVYVREPSGSGYWANITVSFSQAYKEVTIPVTLNVRRVEGGK